MNELGNILVTGASGQLGAQLVKRWQGKAKILATSGNDFAENPAERFKVFDLKNADYRELTDWATPKIIVHCAALTNLDACEDNPQQAFDINSESVLKLRQACPRARIIFISSDAVFPDHHHLADEETPVGPSNIYGQSKVKAEGYLSPSEGHVAVRTTIVGKNLNSQKSSLADWILRELKLQREIGLFTDVFFTPITIWDFADHLEWVLKNPVAGIIHLSGDVPMSKYDFGLALASAFGIDKNFVRPGKFQSERFRSHRSKDQTLSSKKYQKLSGNKLPGLRELVDSFAKNVSI